jgi:hypothetical protein
MPHPHFTVTHFYRKRYIVKGRGRRKEIDVVEGDIKTRQVHITGTFCTGMLSFISQLPDERGTPSHVPYTHIS